MDWLLTAGYGVEAVFDGVAVAAMPRQHIAVWEDGTYRANLCCRVKGGQNDAWGTRRAHGVSH
jgi:hypothetical protein